MKKALLFLLVCTQIIAADINASVQKANATLVLSSNSESLNNNIWLGKYKNYLTYKDIAEDIRALNNQRKALLRQKTTEKRTKEIEELKRLLLNKEGELELLIEHENSIFGNLAQIPKIVEHSGVTNPIVAISAFSHIKQLDVEKQEFSEKRQTLQSVVQIIDERIKLLQTLALIEEDKDLKQAYILELEYFQTAYDDFNFALDHIQTTLNVFAQKVQEVTNTLTDEINDEIIKLITIIVSIVILIVIGFVIKFLIKKYTYTNKTIDDNSYFINKIINVSIIIIAVFVLFLSYLENVTYFVTFLGFASAGIAIAMKDWFMSILGWFVMVVGGSIHVGDRVKFIRMGQEVVGDVLDISLLRITIHEDITLTTYTTTRRAGRIIFIPNHYVFAQAIYNYSHAGLNTVWDGIDLLITFDSDYKKALLIAKEIVDKYSKGYTDITRKQLNKLRRHYNLRNTNMEPRVFSFIDPHGVKISIWYRTNSFATLQLRSTISGEILDAFMKEDDITVAYNTQTLNLKENTPPIFIPIEND